MDQIKLISQLTLCNIFKRYNGLVKPELRAAVAAMTEEQKEKMMAFLKCITEYSFGLPDGFGGQDVAKNRPLLDYIFIIKLNKGANLAKISHKFKAKVVSSLLLKFKNFSVQVKDGLKYIRSLR